MCVCVCLRVSDLLDLQADVSHLLHVLEMEPGFSERAASVLNHEAISSASATLSLFSKLDSHGHRKTMTPMVTCVVAQETPDLRVRL